MPAYKWLLGTCSLIVAPVLCVRRRRVIIVFLSTCQEGNKAVRFRPPNRAISVDASDVATERAGTAAYLIVSIAGLHSVTRRRYPSTRPQSSPNGDTAYQSVLFK